MTRYAKVSTLFRITGKPGSVITSPSGSIASSHLERLHIFLMTDNEGATWRIASYRSKINLEELSEASCPDTIQVNHDYCAEDDYERVNRLFEETVTRAKRDGMVDSAELPEIPDGWEPITPPDRAALLTDPKLERLIDDPDWVMIPIYTAKFGRLDVHGRSVLFNKTPLSDQNGGFCEKLALDLYTKVGGDFAISAGTDDEIRFAAFDLIDEMCLSGDESFDERLEILETLMRPVNAVDVIRYVSEPSEKRAVAHAYTEGRIPTLILRTRCPIRYLTTTGELENHQPAPITQHVFRRT